MVDFVPIESIKHVAEASAIAEIQAFLTGEYSLSEIPFDRDLLSESFLDYIKHETTNTWDDPEYFIKEPETCYQEARLYVEREASNHLLDYQEKLKDHYPFQISGASRNILTRKENVSPVGLSYIWLKLYFLSAYGENYLQFEGTGSSGEKKRFLKVFEKIFEFLAIFAASGKCESKAAWVTGPSRSATDLLNIFNDICTYTGQGRVKDITDLQKNQRTTNDGRIDGIVITEANGNLEEDSEIYLVQATIQKSALKDKTVTNENIKFFNDFFAQQLSYSKSGMLVVPHKSNPLHKSECASGNCVYIPLERLFVYLGQASLEGNMGAIGTEFTSKYADFSSHSINCEVFN